MPGAAARRDALNDSLSVTTQYLGLSSWFGNVSRGEGRTICMEVHGCLRCKLHLIIPPGHYASSPLPFMGEGQGEGV